MKRVLIITTIVFMILAKILKPESENRYYPETGKVVSISGDAVTVETSTGNLFEFYGSEDWFVGDCVSMIMDSCGTPNVTDDMIIDAHYSAWKVGHDEE